MQNTDLIFPNDEIIRMLYEKYNTSVNIISHCRAVAEKAVHLTEKLKESGYELNEKLIYSAAMLHDIARSKPNHAALGAQWINEEGYPKVADIIACHHDLNENGNDPVTEKTIVFLADKLIGGDREIALEERFSKSAAKCITAESKASHERQYGQAVTSLLRVQRLI